jgi:hypothetical protein
MVNEWWRRGLSTPMRRFAFAAVYCRRVGVVSAPARGESVRGRPLGHDPLQRVGQASESHRTKTGLASPLQPDSQVPGRASLIGGKAIQESRPAAATTPTRPASPSPATSDSYSRFAQWSGHDVPVNRLGGGNRDSWANAVGLLALGLMSCRIRWLSHAVRRQGGGPGPLGRVAAEGRPSSWPLRQSPSRAGGMATIV